MAVAFSKRAISSVVQILGRARAYRAAPNASAAGTSCRASSGAQGQREAARRQQAVAPLRRRRRLARPLDHAGGQHDAVAAGFGEGDEAAKQPRLNAEFEAESAVKRHVQLAIVGQHHASSGQGCAIRRSIVISILA
jgi:hypothetical protein